MRDSASINITTLGSSNNSPDIPVPPNFHFKLPANPDNYTSGAVYPVVYTWLGLGTAKAIVELKPQSSNGTSGVISTDNPTEYLDRGYSVFYWRGVMADKSKVVVGNYTLVLKVLRIFGDPDKEEHYEVNETVPFIIDGWV